MVHLGITLIVAARLDFFSQAEGAWRHDGWGAVGGINFKCLYRFCLYAILRTRGGTDYHRRILLPVLSRKRA